MDEFEQLKRKQEMLSNWVADFNLRSDQLLYVQKSLDLTNYQIDVASKIPASLPENIQLDIVSPYLNSTPYWESFIEAFPIKPAGPNAISGFALEASASNAASQTISAVTVGYTPEIETWAHEKMGRYQELQTKQGREDAVREYLSRIFPWRFEEFNISGATFASCVTGSQPQSTWGIHARNLLEHIKGDLFIVAQKALKRQKVKWSDFADALARGGNGSAEHAGLLAEETTYKVLHSELTDLAKNLMKLAELDLRDRRAKLHDHLFVVLSLTADPIVKRYA